MTTSVPSVAFVVGDFYHVTYDNAKYGTLDVRLVVNEVKTIELYNNIFSVGEAGTLRAFIVDAADGETFFDGEFEVQDRGSGSASSAYTELHTLVMTPGGFVAPMEAHIEATDAAGVSEVPEGSIVLTGVLGFDAALQYYVDSDLWSDEVHLEVDGAIPREVLVGARLAVYGWTSSGVAAATHVRGTVTRMSGTTVSIILSGSPELYLDTGTEVRIRAVFTFTDGATEVVSVSPIVTVHARPAARSRCIVGGSLVVSESVAAGDFALRPQSLVLTLDSETWAEGVEEDVPALVDAIIGEQNVEFVASERWFTASGIASRGSSAQNAVSVMEALRSATCEKPDASTGYNRLVLITTSSVVPRVLHPETLVMASTMPSRFIRSGRSGVPLISETSSSARIRVHGSGGEVTRVEQTGVRFDRDFWEASEDAGARISIVVEGDEWQPFNASSATEEAQAHVVRHMRSVLTANMDASSAWASMIESADMAVTSEGSVMHIDIAKQSASTFRLDTGGVNVLVSVGASATESGPPLFLSGMAPTSTLGRLIILPIRSSAIVTRVSIGEAELWSSGGVVLTTASLTDDDAVTDAEGVRASLESQVREQLSIPGVSLRAIGGGSTRMIVVQLAAGLRTSETRLDRAVEMQLSIPGAFLRNAWTVLLPVLTVHPAVPTASFKIVSGGIEVGRAVSARSVRTVGMDLEVSVVGDALVVEAVSEEPVVLRSVIVLRGRTDDPKGWNAHVEDVVVTSAMTTTRTTPLDAGAETVVLTVHVPAVGAYRAEADEVVDVFVSGEMLVKGKDLHAGSFVVSEKWDETREFERELGALDAAHATIRSMIFGVVALKRAARESTDGSMSTSVAMEGDGARSVLDGRFEATDGVTTRLRKLTNPDATSETSMPMEVSDIPLLLGAVSSEDALAASEAVVAGLQALGPALSSRLSPGSTLPQVPIFVDADDAELAAVVEAAGVSAHIYRVAVLPRPSYDEVLLDVVARDDVEVVLRSFRYPRGTQCVGTCVDAAVEAMCVHGENIAKTVG